MQNAFFFYLILSFPPNRSVNSPLSRRYKVHVSVDVPSNFPTLSLNRWWTIDHPSLGNRSNSSDIGSKSFPGITFRPALDFTAFLRPSVSDRRIS